MQSMKIELVIMNMQYFQYLAYKRGVKNYIFALLLYKSILLYSIRTKPFLYCDFSILCYILPFSLTSTQPQILAKLSILYRHYT